MLELLRTNRLILRQWKQDDFQHFAELCADPEVMKYFPAIQSKQESYNMAEKIKALIEQRGWGFWAVEIPEQVSFIGFVGLHEPNARLPFSPCVEIGWRLAKAHWGQGYATEAAQESLKYAFVNLGLGEVVAFTPVANARSRAVMRNIGMEDSGQTFKHPDIEPTSHVHEHVLYKISRDLFFADLRP